MTNRTHKYIKLWALILAWLTGVVLGLAGMSVILELSRDDAVVIVVFLGLFVLSTFAITFYQVKALVKQR